MYNIYAPLMEDIPATITPEITTGSYPLLPTLHLYNPLSFFSTPVI